MFSDHHHQILSPHFSETQPSSWGKRDQEISQNPHSSPSHSQLLIHARNIPRMRNQLDPFPRDHMTKAWTIPRMENLLSLHPQHLMRKDWNIPRGEKHLGLFPMRKQQGSLLWDPVMKAWIIPQESMMKAHNIPRMRNQHDLSKMKAWTIPRVKKNLGLFPQDSLMKAHNIRRSRNQHDLFPWDPKMKDWTIPRV